jgi:hypothetical protein
MWKWELQRLADQTEMTLTVCHCPPDTSKWNNVEHRLFFFISFNWRGQPLVVVNFISLHFLSCKYQQRRKSMRSSGATVRPATCDAGLVIFDVLEINT